MNLITLDKLEQGGITDAAGADSNNMANRVRTLYISIQDDIQYKVVSTSPVVIRYLHFYNSDRVWISGTSRTSASPYIFTPPAGAAFIRIAFQKSSASLAITPDEAANTGKVTLTWNLDDGASVPAAASSETSMNKQGQLVTGNIMEGYEVAGIRRAGYVYTNELIEF